MTWAYLGITLVIAGIGGYLVWSGRKSEQVKEAARANKELHKDIDALVESAHKKEKIGADHEKRIVEIVHAHGLNRGRLVELLNTWPGEDSPPGPTKASGG